MRSTDSGSQKSFNGSTRKSADAFAQNAFLRSSSNEAKAATDSLPLTLGDSPGVRTLPAIDLCQGAGYSRIRSIAATWPWDERRGHDGTPFAFGICRLAACG